MKIAKWLGLGALALAVGGTAQAETIKIGVVLPFSGANADLGHQVDKAFDLYVKLHAKDLAPNTVELVKRDEGPPTGAAAKTVATELITNDKVSILAGFVFSPSAIALAPVVTQAKVPMTFDYDDQSDAGPYPFPTDAPIEGGANSGGDRHVLVIDRDHNTLYETWSSYPQNGGASWSCGSGAKFDLTSDKLIAAMRTGKELKLTIQDASKKPIELALPLLGFGLAFDKTK